MEGTLGEHKPPGALTAHFEGLKHALLAAVLKLPPCKVMKGNVYLGLRHNSKSCYRLYHKTSVKPASQQFVLQYRLAHSKASYTLSEAQNLET